MLVSKELKQRVEAKIQECINIAEAHYDRTFPMPKITYTLRGTIAGTATDATYTINLNAVLLNENQQTFIDRTVVHEFAHLVDGIVNPETRERGYGRKRSVHGPSWKNIMIRFGAEPSRCHTFDVSNCKTKNTSKHVWKCGCGQGEIALGPKRHAKQLKVAGGTNGYYLRGHLPTKCGPYVYCGPEKHYKAAQNSQ